MKKTLAMLLAVLMLLSTTAFATTFDSVTNGDNTGWYDGQNPTGDNGDADIDVSVATRYTDGPDNFGKEAEAATEIWLQVDATGQIDVTVPLVLVFQTNIDGGDAVSPDEYKITNHSSADLVVTRIATTKVNTAENIQPMSMINYDGTPTEDQYAAKIDGITGQKGNHNYPYYDLNMASSVPYSVLARDGGLFELKKAPANDYETGTVTDLEVSMKTGRLSFVTARNEFDEEALTKGIQLLTITYTVAIDTSDAFGEVITTEANRADSNRVLSGENSAAAHTKIVEQTVSEATETGND